MDDGVRTKVKYRSKASLGHIFLAVGSINKVNLKREPCLRSSSLILIELAVFENN